MQIRILLLIYRPSSAPVWTSRPPLWASTALEPLKNFWILTLMRIWIQLFTWMRIRILLLIKVMAICNHWSTDPPRLHFEPPGLHLWASTVLHGLRASKELLNFDFNADPDPVFHFNADPDPLLLTKVMGICDHWSAGPSGHHFEPPGLLSVHGSRASKELLNFDKSGSGSCFSSKCWQSATTGLPNLQGSIYSLQASIFVSVHGSGASKELTVWILTSMRIEIQLVTSGTCHCRPFRAPFWSSRPPLWASTALDPPKTSEFWV